METKTPGSIPRSTGRSLWFWLAVLLLPMGFLLLLAELWPQRRKERTP
jgi:hypothetical protein